MADERYRGALDAAIEDVNKALAEAATKKKGANAIALLMGETPPYDDADAIAGPRTHAREVEIDADTFANYKGPSAAARAYLTMRRQVNEKKKSADIDMIYDALVRGGFAFAATKSDAKDGLAIALGKDKQIVRLSHGYFGLVEWYPDMKKAAAKKNGTGALVATGETDENGEPVVAPADGDDDADESEEGNG